MSFMEAIRTNNVTEVTQYLKLYGDSEGIKKFVKAFTCYHGEERFPPLVYAATQECYEVVVLLAEYSEPAIIVNALAVAINQKSTLIAEHLLTYPDLPINEPVKVCLWYSCYIALNVAVHKEQISLVEKLLAYPGINVNADDRGKHWALNVAVLHYNPAIFGLLLNRKESNFNPRSSYYFNTVEMKHTALTYAAYDGNVPLLNQLLASKKFNVNEANAQGMTPFLQAVFVGSSGCMRVLMMHPEVRLQETDNQGRCALELAIINETTSADTQYETVTTLLTHPIFSHNQAFLTRALFAAIKKGKLDIALLLIVHGADINHLSSDNETPLIAAMLADKLDIFGWLLSVDSLEVNKKDEGKQSCLMLAMKHCKIKALELLLTHPELVLDDTSNHGFSPLMYGVIADFELGVNCLINDQRLSGLDRQDATGDTALIMAARQSNSTIVALLLAVGARTDFKNQEGKSAYDIANDIDKTLIHAASVPVKIETVIKTWTNQLHHPAGFFDAYPLSKGAGLMINALQDNLPQQNKQQFAPLFFDIACLLMAMGDEEIDARSGAFMHVAGILGDQIARHVSENFKKTTDEDKSFFPSN